MALVAQVRLVAAFSASLTCPFVATGSGSSDWATVDGTVAQEQHATSTVDGFGPQIVAIPSYLEWTKMRSTCRCRQPGIGFGRCR